MFTKIDRAKFWLDNGFQLLPCQLNSKSLIYGFGQYRSKIADMKTARAWWDKIGATANMAVLAPENFYILDFDLISVYSHWASVCPVAAGSYTERTPNGGRHVFLRGTPPAGAVLIPGAEIKRIVLVSPSVIDGREYTIVSDHSDFSAPDPVDVLFSLSAIGHASPNFLQADQTRRRAYPAGSRISEIKGYYTISHVLNLYRPEIKIKAGDWSTCACPFHKDNRPSFYFNDRQGVWGCHACNVRGDVINLYARFEAVNVQEAIKRMWAVMA
jgi:hypothetical protein